MENIYTTSYNTYFTSNALSMYMYKSTRKNAKMAKNTINVNHLINHTEDRKINDDRIVSHFVGTLETVVCNSLAFKGHLELSVNMDIFKQEHYANATQVDYHCTNDLRYNFTRKVFYSLESCVNFIFAMYCMIYPYNTISLSQTIYNDPSVKYFINKYYNKGDE